MARPRKKIDVEMLKKLAAIHCTTDEIGAVLGCSKDTLERRYAAILKEGREHGKTSLKRKQFELALNGNVTMLIWLGKIILNQRDKSWDDAIVVEPLIIKMPWSKETLVIAQPGQPLPKVD